MAPIRLGGLASGLDADKLVKDMMKAERAKVDKLDKEKIKYEWTQLAVRDLAVKARDFQSKYFDMLKTDSNMKSSAVFSEFNYTVTSMGKPTNAVGMSVRADAVRMSHTIDNITQLATADTWNGKKSGIAVIKSGDISFDTLLSGDGDIEFSMAIGKTSKKITLERAQLSGITSSEELSAFLNNKIKAAFGNDYSNIVTSNGNKLQFELSGTEVKLFRHGTDSRFLNALGITNGASTFAYKSESIGKLFGVSDEELKDFSINGVSIELKSSMTLDQMTKAINRSGAGVELYFNSLADKVVMKSTKSGSVGNIAVEDGSVAENVLSKLFGAGDLVDAGGNFVASASVERQEGKNAILSLNGTQIIKDSNIFTIDGVTFTLNSLTSDPVEMSAKVDADKVYDKIKTFVDDYNALIEEINKKLTEPKYRGFDPLTEEEKTMITEKQAEKLEEKAKSGLLNNHRELDKMLGAIRSAVVDTMEGGLSLRNIGIQSTSWRDNGKLTIDPSKLKDAIRNDLSKVVETFTRTSEVPYNDEKNKKQRYNESGVMERLDDVIKDYTRTTRNSDGKKGILVNLAGLENDLSSIENTMSKELRNKDKRMDDLLKRLADREEYYYKMFSQMEAAMAKMQQQQTSLAGLLGGMNG